MLFNWLASAFIMAASTTNNLDVSLDMMGQQPLLRIYTQVCFCFARSDAVCDSTSIDTLTRGLERLSVAFPWVAGQVVNHGAAPGNSGVYKITALDRLPRLVVQDLRHEPSAPTMAALRAAEFPMAMLDEDLIAPLRTLPGGPRYSPTDPEPVLLLQANFIQGGLILTVNGQHAAMDMTGLAEIIRLLAKACRGEDFTEEEVSAAHIARDTVVPLLDASCEIGPEVLSQMTRRPSPPPSEIESTPLLSPPPELRWGFFSFASDSLARLKATASKSILPGSGYISTDDAVSALIWQCTGRARLPRLSPNTRTTFARAVDVRQQVGVPKIYPGILQNMALSQSTLRELVEQPLGVVAAQLRSQLDPAQLARRTRQMVTLLAQAQDKSGYSFTASLDPSTDVMLSSWAKMDLWDLDFNLGLGRPESVRRPRFVPVECLMYLLPKAPDGEITAAICLREEDFERLKADKEFVAYGRYVG